MAKTADFLPFPGTRFAAGGAMGSVLAQKDVISQPMPGPSESLPVLEQRLTERLLDFERHDAAWPHAVAEHATFDLKSAPRAVRT